MTTVLTAADAIAAEFIPWSALRNPVFQRDGWSVKDATMLYRGGEFFLVFNAYYEEAGRECCHLVGVTTKDFRTFSQPRFNRSGADRGWLGIAAPNLTEVGDTVCLTYNSWGDKPGEPNQLPTNSVRVAGPAWGGPPTCGLRTASSSGWTDAGNCS